MPDAAVFRNQFPALQRTVYLNAGTEGPMPQAAADAVRAQVERDLTRGRVGQDYFELVKGLAGRARAAYAAVLGADPSEVALTSSTTSGINTVLGGLRFGAGDEILTSDQEHPGLLAPLRRLQVRDGVIVRVAPLSTLAAAVTPKTKLITCSHVAWLGGEIADVAALTATGVPVLLDAAQSLGSIPIDVHALGVDFYAGSGQKWLCGPEGSGALYVRPDRLDDLEPPWPSYATIANAADTLRSPLAETAARLDTDFPPAVRSSWALGSLELFSETGWEWIHDRAAGLAADLAARLADQGLDVLPRGGSTLVAWHSLDPAGDLERLAEAGIIIRGIPPTDVLRASVGAWNDEGDLDTLMEALAT